MAKIVIDPISRIEGHLKIEVVVENGVVKDAHSSGTLFRGFEIFMKGHHPLDAQQRYPVHAIALRRTAGGRGAIAGHGPGDRRLSIRRLYRSGG